MKLPVRTELEVLPADKPSRTIGWTCTEHIGMGVVNPGGVTRMSITTFFYLFELFGYYIYYDDVEVSYYLMDELLKVPTSAFRAKPLASYVFGPDGTIHQDRYGNGLSVWLQIQDVIGVHQVMIS